MKKENYITSLMPLVIAFIGVPIFLFLISDFSRRGFLMDALSLTTILGFTILISQFFLSRLNKGLVKKVRMVNVLKIHKYIGYVFIAILLLHPFFIIVPKFFDNAVAPSDALLKLISTVSSLGVLLGLIGYASILILLITSFFRFKLHLKYKTWRNLHGYLTLIFVVATTWHVIDIGRHSNTPFTLYYLTIVSNGIYYLLKTYVCKGKKKTNSAKKTLTIIK